MNADRLRRRLLGRWRPREPCPRGQTAVSEVVIRTPSGRLHRARSSMTDGPPGLNSLGGSVKLAARDQPHDLPGKTGSAHDPAFGVVVQTVALAGFTLVLGLDSLLARGGYLEEFVLVGMDAAHGGGFRRMTVYGNSRQGAKSGQIHGVGTGVTVLRGSVRTQVGHYK